MKTLVWFRIASWARVPVVAGILSLGLPGAVNAQSPQFGAGWMAGASHVTQLNSHATAADLLEPGTGFVVGMHLDHWDGTQRRIGLRYQGSYQNPSFDWCSGGRRIDALSADLSLHLRERRCVPRWQLKNHPHRRPGGRGGHPYGVPLGLKPRCDPG